MKKRRPQTFETREKIRIGHLGKKNHEWKGDEVKYRALHSWVSRSLGKPTVCEHCGKEGLTGHKIHWANISGKYFRDLADWIRLCASCHRTFDLTKNI